MPSALTHNSPERKLRQALLLAQITCVVFGIGLVGWGIAPAIMHRIASNRAPTLTGLLLNSTPILIGLTFIGLSSLVRRNVTWALWGTVLLSSLLLTAMFVGYAGGRTQSLALFPFLLAVSTALASLLALAARPEAARRERSLS